jgi:hypothetical protein
MIRIIGVAVLAVVVDLKRQFVAVLSKAGRAAP